MKIGGIKGTNLVTGFEFEENQLRIANGNTTMMTIPYPMISNSAVYNNDELEVSIPFENNNEQHDVLCEVRFYVPPKNTAEEDEQEGEEDAPVNYAEELYQTIKEKAKIDKGIGELICTLENLPLVVPRGKYTVDLYQKKMRLDGTTFNYIIDYKNIKKAFLLPMNDDLHHSLVLGFDQPLRQGTTSYHYIIFNFKALEDYEVELNLDEEQLKAINPDLQKTYSGKYYEVVAKLFKMIININIIIPGKFKTTTGHSGIKCNVSHLEGHLFFLSSSMIFIKKPVLYMKLSEIVRIEFLRVTGGISMKNFDFEVVMKNGHSQTFSGVSKLELESIKAYFEKKNIKVVNIKEQEPDLGSEEDDAGIIRDEMAAEDEDDESMDDDFVAPDEGASDDDDEEADEDFKMD